MLCICVKPSILPKNPILNCNRSKYIHNYKYHQNESSKVRAKNLSQLLNCSEHTAQRLVLSNRFILDLDHKDFVTNSTFCSRHLKFSDIIEFPLILSLNSNQLQHRFFSLQELGSMNITAAHILRFPHLIKKSPKNLKSEGLHFDINHYLEQCKMILPDAEYKVDSLNRLKKAYNDRSPLMALKESMNTEFLSLKFNCSVFKAHIILRRYPSFKTQSIRNTNKLLDFLAEKCGFTVSKIFHVPSVLSLNQDTVEKLLCEMPEILGINTAELVRKVPQLLHKTVYSIRENLKILEDFAITRDQILSCPKVLIFNGQTLKQRLKLLSHSSELSHLKQFKKYLWLVYYYRNTETRLKILNNHEIQHKINMFIVTQSKFEKYLNTSERRDHLKDVCFFLSTALDSTESDIAERLKYYPMIHNPAITNCTRVTEHLLNNGVSKSQILNGLGIVFYDVDVVEWFLGRIASEPEFQPFSDWIGHYNLIQLLIYAIERENDFSFTFDHSVKIKTKTDSTAELAACSNS